jgi:hypothetical protein
MLSSEDKKFEIVPSKITAGITAYSSNTFIQRGFELADISIKTYQVLLAEKYLLLLLFDEGLSQENEVNLFIMSNCAKELFIDPYLEKVKSRLIDIAQNKNWDDYARLEALELLALHGYKDYAIQSIMEIFRHPNICFLQAKMSPL